MYWITLNKQEFQIWMTLENDWNQRAYVDGDYKTVAKNLFPSLLLAMTWTSNVEISSWVTISWSNWSTNRLKFIINWSYNNLPYGFSEWAPVVKATSFSWILNEIWVTIPADTTFPSCADIYNWNKYVWTWSYELQSDYKTIINNICDCSSWTNTWSCSPHDNTLIWYWNSESLDWWLLRDLGWNWNNGSTWTTTSTGWKIWNSLSFNWSDACIVVPYNANENVSSITLESWIKSDWVWSSPESITTGMILAKHFTNGKRSYDLYLDHTSNKITFDVYDPSNNQYLISSNTTINNNSWYHVVWLYDNNSGTEKIYINWVFDSWSVVGNINIMQTTVPVTIGCYLNSDDWSLLRSFFKWEIDEPRIYNKALNDKEISDYYNATK